MFLSNSQWARSHGSDIRSTARQPPTTTMEGLLNAVFSVGSAPRSYNKDTSQVPECSCQQFSWDK
jgi:hypothetical protein